MISDVKFNLRGPRRPLEPFKVNNMNAFTNSAIIDATLSLAHWLRGRASDSRASGHVQILPPSRLPFFQKKFKVWKPWHLPTFTTEARAIAIGNINTCGKAQQVNGS